jgi:hypothetical protein
MSYDENSVPPSTRWIKCTLEIQKVNEWGKSEWKNMSGSYSYYVTQLVVLGNRVAGEAASFCCKLHTVFPSLGSTACSASRRTERPKFQAGPCPDLFFSLGGIFSKCFMVSYAVKPMATEGTTYKMIHVFNITHKNMTIIVHIWIQVKAVFNK